jgi:hypothetical protein
MDDPSMVIQACWTSPTLKEVMDPAPVFLKMITQPSNFGRDESLQSFARGYLTE